jgi:hypothetical protein
MTDTTNTTYEDFGLSNADIERAMAFDCTVARYWSAFAAERSAPGDEYDELFGTMCDNIADAFQAVAWTPAPQIRHVTAKVKILQHAMGEAWSNARIETMVASIRKDLEELGG